MGFKQNMTTTHFIQSAGGSKYPIIMLALVALNVY